MSENYSDKFKHLKPIYHNRRKSPEKAILLLTIIRLHELGLLADNEIRFNTELKKHFLSVWKEYLDSESLFAPDLYIPFWYMEEETFWHVVPKEGKDAVIELMKDRTIKPSENVIKEYVEYIELDEDLHFLMTLPSGRLQLRKSLLTTYTNFSPEDIEKLCYEEQRQESAAPKMEELYNSIKQEKQDKNEILGTSKAAIIGRFFQLEEDVQIEMNIQYYTFLKNNKYIRQDFQTIIPDVFVLFDKITCHKIIPGDLSASLSYSYSEFLRDLKISLIGELNTDDFIDEIEHAIAVLEGEEVYEPVEDTSDKIVETPYEVTNNPIETQSYDTQGSHHIKNKGGHGYIYDALGEKVYSTSGGLKEFNDVIYRFNYKYACFTVKRIEESEIGWVKSPKLFVASNLSDLHNALSPRNYINEIDDFIFSDIDSEIKIKIKGVWYDYAGDRIESDNDEQNDANSKMIPAVPENELDIKYEPKGKLSRIPSIALSSYDLLWTMAIIDLEKMTNRQVSLTLDEIACMMIANAWELLGTKENWRSKEFAIVECIEFLIEESQEYMDKELSWSSSKEEVYEAIKNYPMGGIFEDTIELLVESAPINVLKAWFTDIDDEWEIEMQSRTFSNSCLYGFYNKKRDPYIMLNSRWQNNLYYEHDNLINFYTMAYNKMFESLFD